MSPPPARRFRLAEENLPTRDGRTLFPPMVGKRAFALLWLLLLLLVAGLAVIVVAYLRIRGIW